MPLPFNKQLDYIPVCSVVHDNENLEVHVHVNMKHSSILIKLSKIDYSVNMFLK